MLSGKFKVVEYEKALDNSRLIIELVKSKPQLYDFQHDDYSNRFAHTAAWKELAAKLKVSVHDFKLRWNSLRASYARSVRVNSLHPDRARCKWYLEDDMNFLKKHIQHCRKSRPYLESLTPKSRPDYTDEDSKQTTGDSQHYGCSDYELNSNDRSPSPPATPLNFELINSDGKVDVFTILNSDDHHDNHRKPHTNLDCIDEIFKPNTSYTSKIKSSKKRKSLKFHNIIDAMTGFFETQTDQLEQSSDNLFFQSIEKDCHQLPEKKQRKLKILLLNGMNELLDSDA